MAMKSFSTGDVLGAADLNQYCVNTSYASKPSNTSRSSAPGFADDPDLQVPIIASAQYDLSLYVLFQSPSAAGFQFTFTGSGSNNLYGIWQTWNAASGGTLTAGAYDGGVSFDLTGTVTAGGTSGTATNFARVGGVLFTGSSSGTLTFRWSQVTSNATATIVYKGSSLRLRQVS